MNDINDIYLPALLIKVFVVVCVLLLDRFVDIPNNIHPLSFFRMLCERLSSKVNHPSKEEDDTHQYKVLSGFLSLFILVAPVSIIFYLVHAFAYYYWLLDILVLMILFQFQSNMKSIIAAASAMKSGKKELARNLLQHNVIRDTNSLSPIGVYKACEESLIKRYHHQLFAGIFWYLVLGPIAVFVFRLTFEAQQVWSVKIPRFAIYGVGTKVVTQCFTFLPALLFSFTFLLSSQPKRLMPLMFSGAFRSSLKTYLNFTHPERLFLYVLSQANGVETGGPVMYAGEKRQRPRFSLLDARGPVKSNFQSLSRLKVLIQRHLILTILSILALVAWMTLT